MKSLLLLVAVLGAVLGEITPSKQQTNAMEDENEAPDVDELVDDEIIKKCLDNGDKQAYQLAKLARRKLTLCSSSLLHTDKLLLEVRAAVLSDGQGMAPIVKRFCKVYQTSGRLCLNQYLSNLTPCLNETQRQVEELVVRMAETSWEYACHKDAIRGTQFFKNNTLLCLETQSPGLVECIAPYFSRLRAAGDPTRAVAEVLVNKECSTFTSVTRCIVGKLQQCPDPTAAHIVSGSFNETLRISPCADYVEPEKETPATAQQQLQDLYTQQAAALGRLEDALRRLEETREREHIHQDIARDDMLNALERQTALLERVSTSLEGVVTLLKKGRGKRDPPPGRR